MELGNNDIQEDCPRWPFCRLRDEKARSRQIS